MTTTNSLSISWRMALLGLGPLGCGGGDDAGGPVPPSSPASIEVATPSQVLDALGAGTTLIAKVRDADGVELPNIALTWQTLDPAVARVTAGGRVTAVANGVARIEVRTAALADTTIVTVEQRVLSVRITSTDTVLLGLGGSRMVTAIALDPGGSTIAGKVPVWSSSDAAVVTIDGAGTMSIIGSGSSLIRATVDGITGNRRIRVWGTTGEGVASVDEAIVGLLARYGIPGASLAVTFQGRLVHLRGYGLADTTSRAPVVPASRFRIASVSKPITAGLLLQLVEEGKVDLEDRVFQRWLPDLLPPTGPADPRFSSITIRQLLQHTGGWNQPPNDPMFLASEIAGALGITGPAGTLDIIRWMSGQPLHFDPGTARYYSNFGYAVLGRVIERATLQSYGEAAQQRLFQPAGAGSLALGRSLPADRLPDEVAYYAGGAETALRASVFPAHPGLVPQPYGAFNLEAMDAHGGWVASATDLARILVRLDGKPSPADLLGAASRATMAEDAGVPGNIPGYGMGWFRIGAAWYHTGRVPGMASIVFMDDNRQLTFAMLANWSDPTGAFFNDFANTPIQAVTATPSWPTGDLFEQLP